MKKLLVFSVSILCLSLALAIVLHQFGEIAIARSTVPEPTEVVTTDGTESLGPGGSATIPLPTYTDGTSAAESECDATVSALNAREVHPFTYRVTSNVLLIERTTGGFPQDYGYLIICTRAAGGAVAAEQSTWGEIKSLYGE